MGDVSTVLAIKDYCLWVFIGCAPEEYQKKQAVSFDIWIHFHHVPQACLTDTLSDSYCYAEITQLIKNTAEKKHYRLIEHLGYAVFQILQEKICPEDGLTLTVNKLTPPVPGLKGGASFSYSRQSSVNNQTPS